MSLDPLLAGVDLGTTNIKAIVFERSGAIVAARRARDALDSSISDQKPVTEKRVENAAVVPVSRAGMTAMPTAPR